MFSWPDFLVVARSLKTGSEADRRSAVSRAYYAAFHVAGRFVVDKGYALRGDGQDHAGVRRHLRNMKGPHLLNAVKLGRLLEYRTECDYRDTVGHLDDKVESAITDAERLISAYRRVPTGPAKRE